MPRTQAAFRHFLAALVAIGGLVASLAATAQIPGPPPTVQKPATDARKAATARLPDVKPEQLVQSPIPGLYEVRVGAKIAYVSADGRYLVQGEIFDLDTEDNLTEKRRETVRRDAIAGLGESSMVIFAPAKVKHTVTVFTDVDCGYCRKLHQQVSAYNSLGIRVRYLAFPRTGPGTESWQKAEQVWCSQNRNDALTKAKAGLDLKGKECAQNPVAVQYQLGRDFGIQGTPAIITESGELIGGYMDPDELLKHLEAGPAVVGRN